MVHVKPTVKKKKKKEFHGQESLTGYNPWGLSQIQLSNTHFHILLAWVEGKETTER